jgi:hypothetical protein
MPKLPVSPLPVGWTLATVEGITFRASISGRNPMLAVEVSLESGQLTDLYLVISTGAWEIQAFLVALGFTKEAEALRRKRVPAFELDDCIGKKLKIHIPREGGFIKDFMRANETHWTPTPRRY